MRVKGLTALTLFALLASCERAQAQTWSLHGDIWNEASARDGIRQGTLVDTYLYSDAGNSPFSYAQPGDRLATDGALMLGYAASKNLALSLSLRSFSFGYGAYAPHAGLDAWPGFTLSYARVGVLNGLELTEGLLNDFVSSRMGLTFQSPMGTCLESDGSSLQPDQRGVSLKGTLFGTTDFRFSFSRVDQAYLDENLVLFTSPAAQSPERFMLNGRINHLFTHWAGAEVGLTFNRFLSNAVTGLDFQAPIARETLSHLGIAADILGEAAANASDSAAVTGVKLKLRKGDVSLRYQSVGVKYLDGASLRYFGNPPALLSAYGGAFLPDFMGFSNTLGLNMQYAGQGGAAPGSATSGLAGNPMYTYIYPAYNPFRGQGPFYFQAFAPNSRGYTAAANIPIAFKRNALDTHLSYQHLTEIAPNSLMASVFGSSFASNVRMTLDAVTGSTGFTVPIAAEKIRLNLSGSWERLRRIDQTLYSYYPFALNDAVGEVSIANQSGGLVPGSPALSAVSFYPNYVDVRHVGWEVGAVVPITGGLSFSAVYDMQRFEGSYAPPGNGSAPAQNMSQHKSTLSGGFTYDIPRTSSSVALQAASYRFVDDVLPSYNTTWNREDLNFAVRF